MQIDLIHEAGRWSARATGSDGKASAAVDLGLCEAVDLELAGMLARYTELCAPDKGIGRLPFIRLQQRLLSSPEAFAKSLEVHAAAMERQGGPKVRASEIDLTLPESDPDLFGPTDEALQAEDDAALQAESACLPTPTEEATLLLRSLRATAERARRAPDAKVRALLSWMREHLCPAVGKGDDRSLSREDIQRRFNADPEVEPLRILVATDAAREGINLQAHCADLFHIDLPWNPGRIEQRNGRIDRALQPECEVRCHYFLYSARPEDRVLETLVRKIDTVQRELGSLGGVLLEEMEKVLASGISEGTADKLEVVGKGRSTRTVEDELEEARKDEKLLREEIVRAGRRYDASRRALEVSPDALRHVVDVGLRLAGTSGLIEDGTPDDKRRFRLPELDRSWDVTLDTLRPPRPRDESFYDWRKRSPLPVTFSPVARLTGDREQLHLAHPFTKRILDRFLAQGFSAHDLRRVAAVIDPEAGEAHAIGFVHHCGWW